MLILKIEKMIFIRLHVSDRVLGFILAGSERCASQSESWCHNIAHYVDPAGIFLVLFFLSNASIISVATKILQRFLDQTAFPLDDRSFQEKIFF